ncbi:MAG: hypothetical protein QF926_11765, partial [Alphaproteobacteria bacterium]|nr:hypothetical protein [Alphaproteobacteria bacterium]
KERATVWEPPEAEPPDPFEEKTTPVEPDRDAVEQRTGEPTNRLIHLDIGSDVEIADRLKKHLLEKYAGNFVSCDGAFWAFDVAVWPQIPGNQIRLLVHQFDGAKYEDGDKIVKLGKGRVDSIINELRTMLDEPDFFMNAAIGIGEPFALPAVPAQVQLDRFVK